MLLAAQAAWYSGLKRKYGAIGKTGKKQAAEARTGVSASRKMHDALLDVASHSDSFSLVPRLPGA